MHVPLVEQELFTVPEHLGSPLVFSVVRVTRSLVEEFGDTKGVIIIRIRRRTDNTMAKRKSTKGQTTIYKIYT
jgi:hypothetical protein